MPRKSNAQVKIELRLKSLGEERSRLIAKRTEIYEMADEISSEILKIEDKIRELSDLLDIGLQQVVLQGTKEPEEEDAIQNPTS